MKNLYEVEIYKIMKDKKVYIFLFVLITFTIFSGNMQKKSLVSEKATSQDNPLTIEKVADLIEEKKTFLTDQEKQLETVNDADRSYVISEVGRFREEIAFYEVMIKNHIEVSNQYGFMNHAVECAMALIGEKNMVSNNVEFSLSTDEKKEKMTWYDKKQKEIEEIIVNYDVEKYWDWVGDYYKNTVVLNLTVRELNYECVEMRKKIDSSWIGSEELELVLQMYQFCKLSIYEGKNYVFSYNYGEGLTKQEEADIKTITAMIEYKIEKHKYYIDESQISSSDTRKILETMLTTGQLLIIIFISIIGGGMIASEFEKKTIKSIVVSPNKRWKIVLAKFEALLSVAFAFILLNLLISLITFCFLGKMEIIKYVYPSGDAIYEWNSIMFYGVDCLLRFMDVIVVASLTIMISVLSKNTALSVALPIMFYFAGNMVHGFIVNVIPEDFIRFLPISNFNISDKIFAWRYMENNVLINSSMCTFKANEVIFSSIYILSAIILLLWYSITFFAKDDL